jgi:hypothetical protein
MQSNVIGCASIDPPKMVLMRPRFLPHTGRMDFSRTPLPLMQNVVKRVAGTTQPIRPVGSGRCPGRADGRRSAGWEHVTAQGVASTDDGPRPQPPVEPLHLPAPCAAQSYTFYIRPRSV